MQCGSTITSIIIDLMTKLSMASFVGNGATTNTVSRSVAFGRVHGCSTDLAQRKGDEWRFWVPRALDNVGFDLIPENNPCPDIRCRMRRTSCWTYVKRKNSLPKWPSTSILELPWLSEVMASPPAHSKMGDMLCRLLFGWKWAPAFCFSCVRPQSKHSLGRSWHS